MKPRSGSAPFVLVDRCRGSVGNAFLIFLGIVLIILSAGIFPWKPAEDPALSVAQIPQFPSDSTEEAARLEAERLQRIGELEESLRKTVLTYIQADARSFGMALRDLEAIFDEYAQGVDPFVERLHSLGGRGRLLGALGRDVYAMPGAMIRSAGDSWEKRVDGQLWRMLREGELLEIVVEAAKNGYGLAHVEDLVEEMWHEAFDGRIDLAQRVSDRINRLAGKLEASRNRLAREIEGPYLELVRLQGLPEIGLDLFLTGQPGNQITGRAGTLAVQTISAELLAFGGGELAAYQMLQVTRRLTNRASVYFARRMAGSVLARASGTLAAGAGSSWATFGISLAVAVVVEVGLNEVSKHQMGSELRENMRGFHEMFWDGTEESPGLYPQLATAFVEYQSRILSVLEPSKTPKTNAPESTVAWGTPVESSILYVLDQEEAVQ